jgi:two-component system chemotaxis response regulator CheB
VAIVQHMPPLFTTAFARHLDRVSALRVREATDGDRLEAGIALVAPGDVHLLVRASGAGIRVELSATDRVAGHRPSVDVLMRSTASAVGRDAVGVLLTGMGADGADGLGAMRAAGALTIAQGEATSVVYGMPMEAAARGAAMRVLPLGAIAAALLADARRGR